MKAVVTRKLEQRGLVQLVGEGVMWIEKSEDDVAEKTGEVYPELMVTGMTTTAVLGLCRMGPTFGTMLLSGKRVAEIVLDKWAELTCA